jgi:hypothetical protein
MQSMELSFVSTLELLNEVQKRFDTSVFILQKTKTDEKESITIMVRGDRWSTIGISSYAASMIAASASEGLTDPDPEDMSGSD